MSDTVKTPATFTTPLWKRIAAGHLVRTGHKLTGYYAPTGDAGVVKLVRTCCEWKGEWQDHER